MRLRVDAEQLGEFLRRMPKAELHLHIEGTLEPEMHHALARRNGVEPLRPDVDSLRQAYEFQDLQSFLDLYYAGAAVLRTEADFHDLCASYLARAQADGVVRAEIFFDPQTHTSRGVPFRTVIDGLWRACEEARARGLSADLILCFLRHLSAREAEETLEEALPWRGRFIGVGLDSSERGNPPEKFASVFARAGALGLRRTAHAGEEGPAAFVRGSLDALGVERIDHGVRCLEDPGLVARLRAEQVPLTVCPLSNVRLKGVPTLAHHPLQRLLEAGLLVTVNSDDPAYFGGYVGENLAQSVEALGLSAGTAATLARNSLQAAFLSPAERAPLEERLLGFLDGYR